MTRKIKLIWDFRGPNSLKIAEHHCIHLKEYTQMENLHFYEIETTIVSDIYTVAYLIIDEKDMDASIEALKPHRGQVAK
ncbi:MAG: hypothetical protein ACKVIM_01690 [Flavobacteriales bacterium]|jgi:hypothetical protein|tara:strand:- start:545 stop:781 length:237 start_codon:yes stop_codon:yes gene_type:complete